MNWIRNVKIATTQNVKKFPVTTRLHKAKRPTITPATVDWKNLLTLDFETYYDQDYTLKKMSTSEYIRDPRFKAQMMGVKIGTRKTILVPHEEIPDYLRTLDGSQLDLLCHNTAFDGLILSHHYGFFPRYIYDTLSMARGLYSNDIGAGLDEVARFLGKGGKIADILERTIGVRDWDKNLFQQVSPYCARDVELTLDIFKDMLDKYPKEEIDLINLTVQMFTRPLLKVNIPRVEAELKRELEERKEVFQRVYNMGHDVKTLKLTKVELASPPDELQNRIVKKVVGSNEMFAQLLVKAGIPYEDIPRKISPTWLKKRIAGQTAPGEPAQEVFAFSKDDIEFNGLVDTPEIWTQGLDLEAPGDIFRAQIRRALIETLVEARLAVKSTTNITRAERFLTAGANGMPLPCGYAYAAAHTLRWGGNNKMNMQNLKRGGELRQSIEAPDGYVMCVVDSGQIEARVNGWLWGQHDLLDSFRASDGWKKSMGTARGNDRDAYCKFADKVYGREITTEDKLERFVGKVCVLGLGFQMGAPKFQMTLAKGALGGPPVNFGLNQCYGIVNAYRGTNAMIVNGWNVCLQIIEDMASGHCGEFGPITWEKERIWLPSGMSLHYPDLKGVDGERGTQWSYLTKYGRTKIYGGLLCLGAKTQVLTDNGWKRIISVRLNDKLWDGTNWVSHSGLVHQGVKETINFGGVDMTPDHEVLVNNHWFAAEETTHYEATSSFARHYRAPNRHVDSSWSGWQRWQEDSLEGALRLRPYATYRGLRLPEGQHEELRMLDGSIYIRVEDNSRDVATPSVRSMARDAGPLQTALTQSMEALRRERDHSMPAVGHIRSVLGGYAARVRTWFGTGPREERSGVLPRELPVGDKQGQQQKPKLGSTHTNTDWTDAFMASCRNQWNRKNDTALPAQTPVACSQNVRYPGRQEQDVFDLIDAGPLRRFTVRGDDEQPFIVHNCENLVQCLARNIVADQIREIAEQQHVVMITHDEAVSCVREENAERAFGLMEAAFRRAPAWCSDIPLNCEGGWAKNYSK